MTGRSSLNSPVFQEINIVVSVVFLDVVGCIMPYVAASVQSAISGAIFAVFFDRNRCALEAQHTRGWVLCV